MRKHTRRIDPEEALERQVFGTLIAASAAIVAWIWWAAEGPAGWIVLLACTLSVVGVFAPRPVSNTYQPLTGANHPPAAPTSPTRPTLSQRHGAAITSPRAIAIAIAGLLALLWLTGVVLGL